MNWFTAEHHATEPSPLGSPPQYGVLQEAPARHRPVPQRALHGNVQVLLGWGAQVGKTTHLIELAAARSRYSWVAFVCSPQKVDWVRAQLPEIPVFACPQQQVQVRLLAGSGAEELFVDDLEHLSPESSYRLCELGVQRDVTVAVNAQHLPAPEAFRDAWYDRQPQRCGAAVPDLLLRSVVDIELIDNRTPNTAAERDWQASAARRVRWEQDARLPLAHLLSHTLVLLPDHLNQARSLLEHALASNQGRVFAFLPSCPPTQKWPGGWGRQHPALQELGQLCARLRVPLIVPAEHPGALRRACLALQPEHVLTLYDLTQAGAACH